MMLNVCPTCRFHLLPVKEHTYPRAVSRAISESLLRWSNGFISYFSRRFQLSGQQCSFWKGSSMSGSVLVYRCVCFFILCSFSPLLAEQVFPADERLQYVGRIDVDAEKPVFLTRVPMCDSACRVRVRFRPVFLNRDGEAQQPLVCTWVVSRFVNLISPGDKPKPMRFIPTHRVIRLKLLW